jgi:zinc transporter ZupT
VSALLPALIAGAGFAGVALAGLAGLRIGPRLRGAAVGVAAGILLAVALADLFPEALEEAGAKTPRCGSSSALPCCSSSRS